MTKLKHIIVLLASVVAASLTSCVKEEVYERQTMRLNVNITRAGTDASLEQGDGIEDVMLWAFQCEVDEHGVPTSVSDKATGWRHLQGLDTYQSVDLHVELPLCEAGKTKQSYLIVALLNTTQWGTPTIQFNANTTYTQLTSETFDATGAPFWKSYPVDKQYVGEVNNPDYMPISNWATITVSNDNTHPDNCYQLTLPVYRAVGKVQLMMRKTSKELNVTVNDVKLYSKAMPQNGYLLTSQSVYASAHGEKPVQIPVGTTWGFPNRTDGLAGLVLNYGAAGEMVMGNTETNGVKSFTPMSINALAADDQYDWVASSFAYESESTLTEGDNFVDIPAGDKGYYLAVNYTVENNGNTTNSTRYVAIPMVVRNHDYQVCATIDKSVTGYLVINYLVQEWDTKTIDVPSFN